jgi:hypothetical protein
MELNLFPFNATFCNTIHSTFHVDVGTEGHVQPERVANVSSDPTADADDSGMFSTPLRLWSNISCGHASSFVKGPLIISGFEQVMNVDEHARVIVQFVPRSPFKYRLPD